MRERVVAAVLGSLPPLYLSALLLPSLSSGAPIVPFAFLLALAIAAGASRTTGRARGIALLLTVALAIALAATFADAGALGTVPAGLAAGVLVGAPWVASVYLWRPKELLGVRVVAFGLATLLGLLYLAAADARGGPGSALSASGFVSALGATLVNEGSGIGSLFVFGPSSPPVAAVFDPAYALLTGVAALGLLVLILRPQTGEERPLPIALEGAAVPRSELPPVYGFSPDQGSAYSARSLGAPPGTPWPPGIDAVVVAGVVTAAFVGAALVAPYDAVVALTVAIVVLLALVLFAIARPAPFEPPELPPDAAPPAPGPPSSEAPSAPTPPGPAS